MPELPEDEIEHAETTGSIEHVHVGIDDDEGLLVHLRMVHQLDTPDLSGSTLRGLHDRLHGESGAAAE